MEKILEINLSEPSDFLEKYNKKLISRELLVYIINQVSYLNSKDKVKIIIHRQCRMPDDYIGLLKENLRREYLFYQKRIHFDNILQVVFLICGFILLFLSHILKHAEILEEILLIGGWVFIWEMVEMELFTDSKHNHNCRVIKKILKSEIIDDEYQDASVL